MKAKKKRIDDIHACLYKLYNEYVDVAKIQSSIDSSELTSDFYVQSVANLVSSFCMERI